MKPEQQHRVYLFDPSGEKPPKLAFSHASAPIARKFIQEWQREPLNRAAVLWPLGAPAPRATKGGR